MIRKGSINSLPRLNLESDPNNRRNLVSMMKALNFKPPQHLQSTSCNLIMKFYYIKTIMYMQSILSFYFLRYNQRKLSKLVIKKIQEVE